MPSVFYLDYVNGLDATTATPLGWWSVAFTGGSGTAPVADEQATGATSGSTAKLTIAPVISSGSFVGNNAAGTCYWYGKSAAFVSEQINFAGGGHAHIASDFTYCAWKTLTSGATAARIAPGDTIRIAKSTDPTAIGQSATWTTVTKVTGGLPAAISVSGTANNGAGLVRITTSIVHGFSTGNIIHIYGITGTVEANGTWYITYIDTTHFDLVGSAYVNARVSGGSCTNVTARALLLTTAVTKTIDTCDVNWTIGAQTTSATATFSGQKEGNGYIKITTAATCNANQIVAKSALASSINLDTYQQISFWMRCNFTLNAGDLQIRLYSDAACTTLVETFSIPALPSAGGYWTPMTINKGSALSATVQGIAIYTTVQFNSKIFDVDNFIACRATSDPASLTHQSLISKNTLTKGTTSATNYGNEPWWPIQCICGNGTTYNDKIILIDCRPYTDSPYTSGGAGYIGTTESAAIYKRETIKTDMTAGASTAVQSVMDSGTAGNLISYEGGYDTATNVQSSETFFDGSLCLGRGIDTSDKDFISINLISLVRYYDGLYCSGNNLTVTLVTNLLGCSNYGAYFLDSGYSYSNNVTIGNLVSNTYGIGLPCMFNSTFVFYNVFSNSSYGFNSANSMMSCIFTFYKVSNSGSANILLGGNGGSCRFYVYESSYSQYGINISSTCCNNVFDVANNINYCTYGISISSLNNTFKSGNATGNTTADVYLNTYYACDTFFNNFTMASTEVVATMVPRGNARVYSTTHDGTPDNHQIFTDYGLISSDASANRHTLSGICWKLSPTNSIRDTNYPLDLKIARIACVAGAAVTVKVWMKKSHATDIGGRLVIRGGQLTGMTAADYTVTKANDTDYEELSRSFTPTQAGIVEIEVHAFWVANTADESVYVDDFSATQA